jgi:hypothetical protein
MADHGELEFPFMIIETYHTLVSNLKILDSYKYGDENHWMTLRWYNEYLHPPDAAQGFFPV